MPAQDTAEPAVGSTATIAEAAPEPGPGSGADRRLLIDGRLVAAGKTFASINPATGAVIGHAPDAGAEEAEAAIAAARRAFDSTDWPTDVELRIRCLDQLHRALVEHADELRELTIAEVGATRALTQGAQLDEPIGIVRFYADLLRTYQFSEDLGERESRGMLHHRWVEKEAAGVVGAIIAYNYPNQLALAKLAPALAAGCTVVLKGAPDTPLVTLALGELIANHTDIPAGVVNVLSSSDPVSGVALTTSPDVDVITFTGSTEVGRKIMAAASQTVKRVFLELGGKSAAIILDDADIDKTVAGLKSAGLMNNGQACVAQTRILVSDRKHDEVVDALAGMMSALHVGDPADEATDIGPLVAQRQQCRVQDYIRSGRREGARVVLGGEQSPSERGWYVQPTLFADATNDMRIAREEIFGPVLTVLRYRDEDDAIRIANETDYGLAGSVWTSDIGHGLDVAAAVRTGTYGINMYTLDIGAPFGGFKQSGIGREFGPEGLHEYVELQTLMCKGQLPPL